MSDHRNTPAKKTALIALLLAAGVLFYIFGGGLDQQTSIFKNTAAVLGRNEKIDAEVNLQRIYKQISDDAVQQYGMVKRDGDPIHICSQAGSVSAAFLQAKDEDNYQRWRKIEREDCRRAGISN